MKNELNPLREHLEWNCLVYNLCTSETMTHLTRTGRLPGYLVSSVIFYRVFSLQQPYRPLVFYRLALTHNGFSGRYTYTLAVVGIETWGESAPMKIQIQPPPLPMPLRSRGFPEGGSYEAYILVSICGDWKGWGKGATILPEMCKNLWIIYETI